MEKKKETMSVKDLLKNHGFHSIRYIQPPEKRGNAIIVSGPRFGSLFITFKEDTLQKIESLSQQTNACSLSPQETCECLTHHYKTAKEELELLQVDSRLFMARELFDRLTATGLPLQESDFTIVKKFRDASDGDSETLWKIE